MRRTRAILAMLLAVGMAAHAVLTRAPHDAADGHVSTATMVLTPEKEQLAIVDWQSDVDEVMAVDAAERFVPVPIDPH